MTHSFRILAVLLAAACIFAACGSRENTDPESHRGRATPFDTLDRASFNDFIRLDGIKIAEFGGKHCAPCNRMRERLTKLQKEMPELKLGLVFWEDSPELYKDWGVTYIPVQVVFDTHGKETARHVGEWETAEMKEAVQAAGG